MFIYVYIYGFLRLIAVYWS